MKRHECQIGTVYVGEWGTNKNFRCIFLDTGEERHFINADNVYKCTKDICCDGVSIRLATRQEELHLRTCILAKKYVNYDYNSKIEKIHELW